MHAVVFHAPFDLRYEEVPTPTCPPGGILTKTLACGICGTDMRTYRGGSAGPSIPGSSDTRSSPRWSKASMTPSRWGPG